MQVVTDDELARIAERVSLLLQLDRLHGRMDEAPRQVEVANLPETLTQIFEDTHAVRSDLSATEVYAQLNRRIAALQTQVYLLRIEAETRAPFDPASILGAPQTAALYGDRVAEATKRPRSFEFGPDIVAQGFHPTEIDETGAHRWMSPGPASVACIPHLGQVDQIIEIAGNYVSEEQIGALTISIGPVEAEIYKVQANPRHFISRLTLPAPAIASPNYIPVCFQMTDFRQPSEHDTRALGANISRFTCRAATRPAMQVEDDAPEADGADPAAG